MVDTINTSNMDSNFNYQNNIVNYYQNNIFDNDSNNNNFSRYLYTENDTRLEVNTVFINLIDNVWQQIYLNYNIFRFINNNLTFFVESVNSRCRPILYDLLIYTQETNVNISINNDDYAKNRISECGNIIIECWTNLDFRVDVPINNMSQCFIEKLIIELDKVRRYARQSIARHSISNDNYNNVRHSISNDNYNNVRYERQNHENNDNSDVSVNSETSDSSAEWRLASQSIQNIEHQERESIISDTIEDITVPKCSICMENNSIIIFNCGHLCSCNSCSSRVQVCPICRVEIRNRQRVYFS